MFFNLVWRAILIGFLLFINLWRHGLESIDWSPNKSAAELMLGVINKAIYFAITDGVSFTVWAIEKWWEIKNPVIRFGIFFGAVMAVINVRLTLKQARLARRMSIYCPLDETRGMPISGTYNRYRCRRGHQFNGDPHGIQ